MAVYKETPVKFEINKCTFKDHAEPYATIEFDRLFVQKHRCEIELNQTPSEKLFVEITLDINEKGKYTYDILLDFTNNVHKTIDRDTRYVYEVMLQVQLCERYEESVPFHKYLLAERQERVSKSLRFTGKRDTLGYSEDSVYTYVKHMCVGIRRCPYFHHPAAYIPSKLGAMKKLRDGVNSDVFLEVDGKVIPTHSFILTEISPVFNTMLTTDMTEKRNGVVRILDFTVDAVEEMLNFIYLGKVSNVDDVAQDLYEVAQKYEIEKLLTYCRSYFVFNMNDENIVAILGMAFIYNDHRLSAAGNNYVQSVGEKIIKTKDYQDYLCRSFNKFTIINTLQQCKAYGLNGVELQAIEYVKKNRKDFANFEYFLDFIDRDTDLRRKLMCALLQSD